MEWIRIEKCRICGRGNLETVIDLGEIYPSNFVEETDGFNKVPLVLVRCVDCGLVQLLDTVNLDSMYRKYFYKSGSNPSMVKALKQIADRAQWHVTLEKNDKIVDIGCNDGTLFEMYPNEGYTFIGYDPARNLAVEATQRSTIFYNDYFSAKNYNFDKAKIVTSIAMFYDLPDPPAFVEDVRSILHPEGIWVMQFTDLVSMLKINAFDNICHEHLEYYSLRDIVNLVGQYGLEVVTLDRNKVNGGSLQLFIAHKGKKKVFEGVNNALLEEERYLDLSNNPFVAFTNNVLSIKMSIMEYLEQLERQNKVAYGLGASTKGNTLLQYFGISGGRYIQKIADINPEKWGLKTIGTNIPIISEAQALDECPTTFLVLPWHFIDYFTTENKKLMCYLDVGSFTVPMPRPALYFRNGGHLTKIFLDDGQEDTAFARTRKDTEIQLWA